MKQFLLIIVIISLGALAVYLFIEFFQAAETVKVIKKEDKTGDVMTGSSNVYTGAVKKAKKVKGTVESRQREMMNKPSKTKTSSGTTKSQRQVEREKRKEDWYRDATK